MSKREKAGWARDRLKKAKEDTEKAHEYLDEIGDGAGAKKAKKAYEAADDAHEHVDSYFDPKRKG
jgi:hypothetical protein